MAASEAAQTEKTRSDRSRCLVVVESPAKAKTINKILGAHFIVRASYGHVRDLPKNELGVDLEHDFAPTYVRLKESASAIKALKESLEKVDRILIASDPDREGEAIGWHIAELLKGAGKPFDRIVFNAITKRNVLDAIKHPRPIDENLVNAQQARRVLDRLVGYKISPLLQFGVKKGLSAGRVQSVAVRMVCEREDEIRAFRAEEYWTIDVTFETDSKDRFVARLSRIGAEKAQIGDKSQADAVMADLDGAKYRVAGVERKEARRNPAPPFITSSLQQEASRRLYMNPRRTMRIAQELYEGITLGAEGSTGLITYMRTDSTRVDQEALDDVRGYIAKNFEPAMLPASPNVYVGRKGAQDAHEAIRPTTVDRTPESVKQYLSEDQYKLYSLIWVRFVASQMTPAILDQMTIDVGAKCRSQARISDYTFRATGSLVKFLGFTKLYEESADDTKSEEEDVPANSSKNGQVKSTPLPSVSEGDPLAADGLKPEQHFTKPPARYTEASLIRALEENGIGRPSTYAPTINTIMERGYVDREKNRLKPTPLGEEVNKILIRDFPDILDIGFTARLEEDLDHVEEGRQEWHGLLRSFYTQFVKDLDTAQGRIVEDVLGNETHCPECGQPFEIREGRFGLFVACRQYPTCKTTRRLAKKTEPEKTDEVCDKCGSPMVIREGRFGRFLACSTYPKCKNTHALGKDGKKAPQEPKEPPKKTDQKCPTCGAFLLIRKARNGSEFYGCEKYPKCKYTKPMELGLKCPRPGCDGDLVSKLAKRRRFIGCDKYPQCDFAVFGQIDKSTACPSCGYAWTALIKERNKSTLRKCPVPSCGFQETIADESEAESES